MRITLRRRMRTSIALVAVGIVLAGTGVASAGIDPPTARPGAVGLGDYLFPNLGNGGYNATHYTLRLRYPTSEPVQPVSGVIRIDAIATQHLSSFNLDFGGDTVAAVQVDNRPARIDWQKNQTTEELVITPPRPLRKGRTFSAEITFTSHPTAPAAGNLLPFGWIATPSGSFTSFQPDGAHRVFPVNDHPSDKATWSFRLDVPAGVTAIANGGPGRPRSTQGRTMFSYDERQPMAAELMQIAVGTDLSIVQRGTVAGVTMRDAIANGPRALFEPAFAGTAKQLPWLTSQLGEFPSSIYGNLGVDQQFAYALETQGLTLYSPTLFDPKFLPGRSGQPWFYNAIQVHEAAHEYFGNAVSPAMWSDVWLNEGPATWFERQYEVATNTLDEWGYNSFPEYVKAQYAQGDIWRTQYGPVARPKPGRSLYDSPQIYDGGAVVLYALRQKVGTTTFQKILRGWVQQMRGSSRSTDDFIQFASREAGQNLTTFLGDWLYSTTTPPMPGHPDWTVDPVDTTKPAAADTPTTDPDERGDSHAHPGQHAYGLATGP